MTIKYNISGNDKPVEGFSLGKYFAGCQTKQGWKVTHVPSGCALCDPYFDSKETAQALVMAVEIIYKDALNCDDPLMLQKPVQPEYREEQGKMREFLALLNEHPLVIVAGYYLDWFREHMGV